jgi:hypothetical protein
MIGTIARFPSVVGTTVLLFRRRIVGCGAPCFAPQDTIELVAL